MKTNFIIVINIIVAFLFVGGCTPKKNFDFKVSVVPQTYNSAMTLNDMNKAAEIINKRLEYFFRIPQKRIKLDVTENQISLTIFKVDTSKIDLIKDAITGYAKLEFWETYENGEIIGNLSTANNMLRDIQTTDKGTDKVKTAVPGVPADTTKKEDQSLLYLIKKDTSEVKEAINREEFTIQNPLFGILNPRVNAQGEPLPSCMIGLASGKDTAKVNRYMQMAEIKTLFPHELKLMWSQNPHKYDPSNTLYELHAIKVTTNDRQAPLNGSVITSAKPRFTNSGVKINLTMNTEGAKTWAKITRENINRCIAVVLNGYVRSYPRVMGEITGVNTEITGDFTNEEADDLANILKSGGLPFELQIVEEQIIERE